MGPVGTLPPPNLPCNSPVHQCELQKVQKETKQERPSADPYTQVLITMQRRVAVTLRRRGEHGWFLIFSASQRQCDSALNTLWLYLKWLF